MQPDKMGSYAPEDVVFLLRDISNVTLELTMKSVNVLSNLVHIILKCCQSNISLQKHTCHFFTKF